MKRALALLLVLLPLGCTASRPVRQPQGTPVEAVIRSLDEEERRAVLDGDTTTLQRLWSGQILVNAPSNRVSSDRSVVFGLMRQGLIEYASFERNVEQLRVDGDFAVVMGAETIRPTGRAPQAGQTVRRRFTHIWRNEAGVWRLIARHANIVPNL